MFKKLFGNKEETTKKEVVSNNGHKVDQELRDSIKERLIAEKLLFVELNSRMNYGMIGHLKYGRNGNLILLIFEHSFYCHDKNFTINRKTLPLIQDIQKEYAHNTRDEHNRITVIEGGIGYTEEMSNTSIC